MLSRRMRSRLRAAGIAAVILTILAVGGLILINRLPVYLRMGGIGAHLTFGLAVLVVPLTLAAGFFRTPLGSRYVTKRYIVRPFRSVKTTPQYDGERIAELLYRNILDWGPTASRGGLQPQTSGERATFSLGVANFAISTSWIGSFIRRIVTNSRDVTIGGVVHDGFDPPHLRVWLDGVPGGWEQELDANALGSSLSNALSYFSLSLLEAIAPRHYAQVCWARGQFRDAARVFAGLGTGDKITSDLVAIDLARGNPASALRRAKAKAKGSTTSQACLRRDLHVVEALTQQGMWAQAEALLGNLERRASRAGWRNWWRTWMRPRAEHEFRRTLSAYRMDVYAYGMAFEPVAEEGYGCVRRIMQRLEGLVSEFATAGVDGLFGVPAEVSEEVSAELWSLFNTYNLIAQCLIVDKKDASGDLGSARLALAHLRALQGGGPDIDAMEGMIVKDMARVSQDKDATVQLYDRAIVCYSNAIGDLRGSVERDRGDVVSATQLAWCYFGKLACLREGLRGQLENPQSFAGECEKAGIWLDQLFDSPDNQVADVLARGLKRVGSVPRGPSKEFRTALATSTSEIMSACSGEGESGRLDEWLQVWFGKEYDSFRETIETLLAEIGLKDEAGTSATPGSEDPKLKMLEEAVRALLHAARGSMSDKQIEGMLEGLVMRRTALNAFGALTMETEPVHRAEGYYGLACFHAQMEEADATAAYLETAMAMLGNAGDGNLIRNRSKLDNDLNPVRDHEEVRRVIMWPDVGPEGAEGGNLHASS